MNTAEQILVIILSTFLAIFLLLAIGLTVMIIQLVKKLRVIADSAHHVTENIESAAQAFSKAAGPVAFSKVIGTVFGIMKARKQGRK